MTSASVIVYGDSITPSAMSEGLISLLFDVAFIVGVVPSKNTIVYALFTCANEEQTENVAAACVTTVLHCPDAQIDAGTCVSTQD